MGPLLPAGKHRRGVRLDGHHAHGGFARFEHFAHPGDGAAGADAGNDDIHLAIRIAPDLFGGGAAVDLGVGRVLELLGHEVARVRRNQLFGLADGAGHAFCAGGKDQLGPIGAQQHTALFAHRIGHDQGQLVAPGGAHKGQANAGIAAGRLDDDGIGFDLAGLLGGFDHRYADAVLNAVGWVEVFQLGSHFSRRAIGYPAQAHQGGIANQFGYIVCDAHNSLLKFTVAVK